jgi:hypothetical protein
MHPDRTSPRSLPSTPRLPRGAHNPLLSIIAIQLLLLLATVSCVNPQNTAAALEQLERADLIAFVK